MLRPGALPARRRGAAVLNADRELTQDEAREQVRQVVAMYEELLSRGGSPRDAVLTPLAALRALAAAPPAVGGDAPVKVCGWCAQEGHTTDEHHDAECEREWESGAMAYTPCRCAERARAALPRAAVGGDAEPGWLPEEVLIAALQAADKADLYADEPHRDQVKAAAEVAYAAGRAAAPGGERLDREKAACPFCGTEPDPNAFLNCGAECRAAGEHTQQPGCFYVGVELEPCCPAAQYGVVVPWSEAWRVPSTDDPVVYGVLVWWREVMGGWPTWWLLCPGGATMYTGPVPAGPCSDPTCEWQDIHTAAAALAPLLTGGGR